MKTSVNVIYCVILILVSVFIAETAIAASAPVFITSALPNATENADYFLLLEVNDADANDIMVFEITEGPEWLTVNEAGELTGTPLDKDVGEDIIISISATDRDGLADTFTGAISVIDALNPPVFVSESLTSAVANVAYSHVLLVNDADANDIITFTVEESPEWFTVDEAGLMSGTPTREDAGEAFPVTLIATDQTGLADTLVTTIDVVIVNNVNAFIELDTDLAEFGLQGGDRIENPGPNKYVGVAVYVSGVESLRSFWISLSWDGEKAVYKSSRSGPDIVDDEYDINGVDDLLFAEEDNILNSDGGSSSSIVEDQNDNLYTVVTAKLGGDAVIIENGLLYFAAFRTTDTFDAGANFTVDVEVKLLDDDGVEVTLDKKTFSVGYPVLPPTDIILADIPDDQGHNLELSWTPSVSEDTGLIDYYRIYRSTATEILEIALLSDFEATDEIGELEAIAQIEAIEKWEDVNTTLIDSVLVGENMYLDVGVPSNKKEYTYWIQAVGSEGESEKAAIGAPVAVDRLSLPAAFALNNPYPNPFNPSTTIGYYVPSEGEMSLTIFNAAGQKVTVLKDGHSQAGAFTAQWRADDMPSGLYFCTLKAGSVTKTRKMLLLK